MINAPETNKGGAGPAAATAYIHFRLEEFACECGCGANGMDPRFLAKLDRLRSVYYQRPLTVSSGYRCPVREAAVGGSGANHPLGVAADLIVPKGAALRDFVAGAFAVGIRRVIVYHDKPHTHVDDNPALPEGIFVK